MNLSNVNTFKCIKANDQNYNKQNCHYKSRGEGGEGYIVQYGYE